MDIKISRALFTQSKELLAMAESFHLEDGHPLAETSGAALEGAIRGTPLAEAYVVEQNGTLIGYFVLCFTWSIEFGGLVVILDDLYLKKEFRNQGIGSLILSKVKEIAIVKDAVQIFLEVEHANQRAMQLYQRNGFSIRERFMMEFFPD